MNELVASGGLRMPIAPTTGAWIDRAFRRLVHSRLERVRGGWIVLLDGGGRSTFGATEGAGLLSALVKVHDPRFYRRVLSGGSLGAAEAFIDGLWSCDDLPALLRIFVRSLPAADELDGGAARIGSALRRLGHAARRNTRRGSSRNIQAHYDLGNEFFARFLDESMTYSCGIFEREDATMEEASEAKLDRICRLLELEPGDDVLEIGTGWGSFAIHAASRYGCRVTTATISREQHALAVRRVREAGVNDRVRVLLRDYRDLHGRFDKLVSIEMIEAVGHEYLETFFDQCSRRLGDGGLMALQAITMPSERYERYRRSVDFIRRHVFPGSCVPSRKAIEDAVAGATDLRVGRVDDITPHYVTTLRCWRRRFHANHDAFCRMGCTDRFLRLWDFYLAYCEAGFAERYTGTVQMLLAKPASGRRERDGGGGRERDVA